MRQEFLLNMRHHNASWESLSWVTRLNLPRKIMYDRLLTGDGLTLLKCENTPTWLVCARMRIQTYLHNKPSYRLSDVKLPIHWVNCRSSANMLRVVLVV